MASRRYCISLGSPIDSLAQRGLAKCAASEPRKLFPFFFLPCESQHAREAAALFSTFLRKLLSASFRRKELPLESRRCVVRHASRAYITVRAFKSLGSILFVAAARRSILILRNRTTNSIVPERN